MKSSKSLTAFFWDYTNLILKQGTSFILGIFLARLLTPEDFGLMALMVFFNTLANSVVQMGFYTALIREKENNEDINSSVFWLNLAIGIFMTIVFNILSKQFAIFFNAPELNDIVKITSLTFISTSLSIVQQAILSKELNFKIQAQAQITSMLISGSIAVILAFNHFGVWSIVWQVVIASYTTTLIIWFKNKWRPKLHFNIMDIKHLWSFTSFMFFSSLINTISEKLDSLLIGKFISPLTLGNYSRAQSINTLMIKFTSESISKVSFPLIVAAETAEKKIELNTKALHMISFLIFPIIIMIHLNAELIIVALFGEKWLESSEYLKLTAIIGFAFPINAQILSVIKSSGKSNLFFKAELIKMVIYFSFLLTGFFWGGINYMIMMMLIAALINTQVNIKFANIALQNTSNYQNKIIGTYGLITILIWLGIQFLNGYPIFQSLAFVSLYILTNLAFKMRGLKLTLNKLGVKS